MAAWFCGGVRENANKVLKAYKLIPYPKLPTLEETAEIENANAEKLEVMLDGK